MKMSKKCFTILAVLLFLLSTLASIDALHNHTGEQVDRNDTSFNVTNKDNGTGTNHSYNLSFNAGTDYEINETKKSTNIFESTTIHVPADYDTIQTAINHSSSGTTIIVSPKSDTDNVYKEHMVIDEGLSDIMLIANGEVVIWNDAPGVSTPYEGDQITVLGERCTIQGFDIRNGWTGGTYPNYPGAGVRLCSGNNTVRDNYIYNTSCGVIIEESSYNTIENNTIRNTLLVMAIWGDYNIIANNTFGSDDGSGWRLGGSVDSYSKPASYNIIRRNTFVGRTFLKGSDNLIYDNKFSWNDDINSENSYNISKTPGTNIVGGSYLGGNYWSDYTGTDTDGDGIGDTPHSYDQLPLVMFKSDLVVTGIASEQVIVNTTTAISVTVANKGSDVPSFNLSLRANEELIETKMIDPLSADTTIMSTFTWRPTATGSYTLKAIADSDDAIAESNETNNELEEQITVLMRVTVVIKDVTQNIYIQELSLHESEPVLEATELACEALKLSFNEIEGIVTEIDGLENPKLFLYDEALEQWTATGMDHKLEGGDVIGWSKADDLSAMLPDLTVTDIIIAGGVGYPNITNKIRAVITNDGFASTSNVSVVFKVNDVIIGDDTTGCINRTESGNVSFGWMPNKTGSYKLSVDVDPQNNITELNETNNNITKDVTVELLPAVVHVSSIVELQDMIDISPAVVASHGWMTIYLDDEGRYEETVGLCTEHTEIIALKDKRNLTITSDDKSATIALKVSDVIGTRYPGVEVISISNSSNLELQGFTVAVLKKKENMPPLQNTRNIAIENSNNVTLRNLMLPHQGNAREQKNIHIKIENSRDCVISDNIMPDGAVGINLFNADNNLIQNNTIYFDKIWENTSSIYLNGNNNTIYANNLFGPAKDYESGNHWNSTHIINYSYNFSNYTGNYWYDYKGADENGDGIGDTPYIISADSKDFYPLIEPHGLSFDIITTGIIVPSKIYANRASTILAPVEFTGTYPLPVQIHASLRANGEITGSKTITMNNGEHKAMRFEWTPQNTGIYRLAINVNVEELIEAVKEKKEDNNNISIDMVTVSSAPYNYATNLTSAVDYLNESQYPTGSICGFSNSGWAALGLIAAGEDPTTGIWNPYGSSLIDYLRNNPEDEVLYSPPGTNPPCLGSLDAIARMVMVVSATGEDPTNYGGVNYLVTLKSYYDGKQFGYNASVADDAHAILALVACGEGKDKRVNGTVDYILTHQNSDGGWSDLVGAGSSVEVTAYVIQALVAAGVNKESDAIKEDAIKDALAYIRNNQNDDGGYSNVRITTSVIRAIVAAGDDPLSYTKNDINPLQYLLSLQQEDGSFNYSSDMSFFPPVSTTYSISALCGVPHPEMIRTLGNGNQYETPDVSVSQMVIEDEICVNTSYNVYAGIKSNGGIFDVNLSSEDGFIQGSGVNSVWHESFSNVSFTWKPERTGRFNLTVFADSNGRIDERSHANNNLTKQVEVVYPDLYPSAIEPPAISYVNVTNTINCTVNGTTDERFNVSLKEADGELVGEQRIKGIRDNITISFAWRPSENGVYNLILTADADNEVHERANDMDNTLTKTVNVLLPDLIPANVTAEDGVYVNATNRIGVSVTGMAESFNVSLIENGTVVGKTCNVTCYGVEIITVYWKPTALGNHTLTVFVDSDKDIRETNEANNNMTKVFEAVRPDLVPVEITPHVLYIDEVNTIFVKVNGTAEGFNATLTADEMIDKSGPLWYVISPIFNVTPGRAEVFFGNTTGSHLTYNITEQRASWSWTDIDTLDVNIGSNTSTRAIDDGDAWNLDYVAVVVNYIENSTIRTIELNVNDVIATSGNWSNESNVCTSDDEYATTHEIAGMRVAIRDVGAIHGNITSVLIKVNQHVANAFSYKRSAQQKKTNLDTYKSSIEFKWLTTAFGDYNLTVFLDSDDNINETDEANNNLTEVVYVRSRIALELTAPVGGETFNGTQNITWNATYKDPVLIDLFYSPDRGYRWIPVATNVTNNGAYAWNTKDVIDGEYMVKMVARTGIVRAEDQSDIFYVLNTMPGTEWGSFHANAGYALSDAPAVPDIADYSEDIAAEGSASIIVARGKVFVYCTGWKGMYSDITYLVALNQSNLKEIIWATPISPRVYGSWATPAYKDRSIFVTSGGSTGGGGYVYRINADTGEIEWEFKFPGGYGSVNGGPAVTSRAVYAGDWDGKRYYSIDAATGEEIYWVFNVTGNSQSVPAIGYGNAYFGDAYNGSRAYCVNAWSGKEIWNTTVAGGKNICGTVTIADNIVYFTTYDFYGSGIFYALDAYNGSIVWENTTEPTDSTPAYKPPSDSVRAYVYIAGGYSTKEVCCLDAKNGSILWRVPGLGSWTNSPIVTKDGKVLVGKVPVGKEGGGGMIPGYMGLYCLDALTGDREWHTELGGSSPVLVGGIVYTIGNDGRVYAFGKDGAPDLIVRNATKQDIEYVVEKPGMIKAMIQNTGKSDVTEDFYVELREKGKVLCNKQVSGLNASDTKKVVFNWTPQTPGVHNLMVEVDPGKGVIPESNSMNNTWGPLRVKVEDNKPDLVASILNVPPGTSIHEGTEVTIEINISNIGYETNESFWVRFSVDDVEKDGIDMTLDNNTRTKFSNFNWTASGIGNHTLTVEANPPDNWTINELNRTNNNDSSVVEVIQPTVTPTPTSPGIGPGSGGGAGGGSAGRFGAGSGTGESGAGEAGGMQIPVNASTSAAEETKNKVSGFPFGNSSSGASGGGGTLPLLFLVFAIFITAVFYFGYYKEKRSHAKHISPGGVGKEKVHKRDKDKK